MSLWVTISLYANSLTTLGKKPTIKDQIISNHCLLTGLEHSITVWDNLDILGLNNTWNKKAGEKTSLIFPK